MAVAVGLRDVHEDRGKKKKGQTDSSGRAADGDPLQENGITGLLLS